MSPNEWQTTNEHVPDNQNAYRMHNGQTEHRTDIKGRVPDSTRYICKRITTTIDHINRTAFAFPISAMTSTNIVFADPPRRNLLLWVRYWWRFIWTLYICISASSKAALDCRETLGWQFMVTCMLENSLWIWFWNFKEPFYMPWDYQFPPVVRSSSCSYPVCILYSSVLCGFFFVFQFGCLFVVSGVNPGGILCFSVKCSFNVRFMRGVDD